MVNYRDHPEWATEIMKLADGTGVDKVVEIGGAGTIGQSVGCTCIGGEIGLVGFVAEGNNGLSLPTPSSLVHLWCEDTPLDPRRNFEARECHGGSGADERPGCLRAETAVGTDHHERAS